MDREGAARCRGQWQSTLADDNDLTEAALLLPPDYPASFRLSSQRS